MKALGFDPGAKKGTAWACYDSDEDTLTAGTLRPGDELVSYYSQACDLMRIYEPDVVGLETQYPPRLSPKHTVMAEPTKLFGVMMSMGAAAIKLGYVRGLLVAASYSMGVPVVEIAPASVKLALTGSGRASKEQMKAMVEQLYGKRLGQDRADAAAVAVAALRRA